MKLLLLAIIGLSYYSYGQPLPFGFFKIKKCPSNYVRVPKNTNYVSSDFCIMKYEAKAEVNAGGSFDTDGLGVNLASYKPASVAANQPWADISRDDSRAECQSLGASYDLPSNAQWQTLARNLELVATNWSGGSVGTGCIFGGNNGETACGYNSPTDPDSGALRNSRAILTLSNSETVYDIAGNVWELTLEQNNTNYGSDAYFSTVTDITHPISGTLSDSVSRKSKAQFGPSGTYSTSNNNSGLGIGKLNGSAGAVIRGSDWDDSSNAGIFSLLLIIYSGTSTHTHIGFRCIYNL